MAGGGRGGRAAARVRRHRLERLPPHPATADLTAPFLSIVIPNLDGARWLTGCLASLAGQDLADVEVVVADDGSRDDSATVAGRHGARFVPGPARATGFAATANRGIDAASGEWILLLNNDTELAADALSALRAAIGRNADAAMLAPLVRSLRNRAAIDSAGLLLFPDGSARPRWHGRPAAAVRPGDAEVLVPSGAAAVIRREWIDRVGPLDASLVAYGEDLDLGLRIRRAGGLAVLVPDVVVFHHFSGTTGALSPAKARLIERNHVVIGARHLPLGDLVAMPVWTLARWVVLVAAVRRARGRGDDGGSGSAWRLGAAVLLGTAAGVARLPRALRERSRLNAASALDRGAWRRLVRRHRAALRDYLRFGE